MRTIVVDDEELAIMLLKEQIKNAPYIEIVGSFSDGTSALEYASKNKVELAILDIDISDNKMNGISLGQKLHFLNPEMLFIYVTASEDYAMQAMKLHAADYLTKPYSTEELLYAIESARLLSRRSKKRIFARTFGHFDLFVDDKPVMFKSAKAKELLALLVDRQGGTVTTDQIIGTLWEDRPNDAATQNLCSKVGKTLEKELENCGAKEIIVSTRGLRRADTDKFDCDLYDLLAGDEDTATKYIGEYMLEYSWAENRMAMLGKFS